MKAIQTRQERRSTMPCPTVPSLPDTSRHADKTHHRETPAARTSRRATISIHGGSHPCTTPDQFSIDPQDIRFTSTAGSPFTSTIEFVAVVYINYSAVSGYLHRRVPVDVNSADCLARSCRRAPASSQSPFHKEISTCASGQAFSSISVPKSQSNLCSGVFSARYALSLSLRACALRSRPGGAKRALFSFFCTRVFCSGSVEIFSSAFHDALALVMGSWLATARCLHSVPAWWGPWGVLCEAA